VVGITTLISRITGLARDMVYSQMIPVGALDAFLVAYKIPNFLRRLFAEGSFSQSFVPVISEYKVKKPHDDVRELVDGVAGTFGAILFLVTVVGVIAVGMTAVVDDSAHTCSSLFVRALPAAPLTAARRAAPSATSRIRSGLRPGRRSA